MPNHSSVAFHLSECLARMQKVLIMNDIEPFVSITMTEPTYQALLNDSAIRRTMIEDLNHLRPEIKHVGIVFEVIGDAGG